MLRADIVQETCRRDELKDNLKDDLANLMNLYNWLYKLIIQYNWLYNFYGKFYKYEIVMVIGSVNNIWIVSILIE